MSRTLQLSLALILLSGGVFGTGCSKPEEAPMVEGKTPAEFREELESKSSRPLGPPPAKSDRKK